MTVNLLGGGKGVAAGGLAVDTFLSGKWLPSASDTEKPRFLQPSVVFKEKKGKRIHFTGHNILPGACR